MEDEISAHKGQHDVGVVAAIWITKPFSVIWICSICIPSGRASREAPSITTSLYVRELSFADYHGETLSLHVNLYFYTRQARTKPQKWSRAKIFGRCANKCLKMLAFL